MNDLPSLPDAGSTAGAAPAAARLSTATTTAYIDADQVRALVSHANRRIVVALVLLALAIVGLLVFNRMQASSLRDETARHLRQGEMAGAETRLLVKAQGDTTRDLLGKVSVLESKQVEAQSQQLALEQLYQDLSKNRDDWALAEIEQVLSIASQQLQLAGNVPGALIALQNADARLSRSDKPQFIVIRRALAHDIERLKALPTLDLPGIALRLDSIIGQIDSIPLLADEKPALPAIEPKRSARPVAAKPATGTPDWVYGLEDTWQSWTSEMWADLRQLIRVRTVDLPDALLLSPTQAYYARENLKLRLLNARLALLSRNESAFRSDMIGAQEAVARYFDTRARQTQTIQALLRQVQSSNLAIELPALTESLNAVRNYKAKP
jgi:uroporphyrin-3 C-methyltransferase